MVVFAAIPAGRSIRVTQARLLQETDAGNSACHRRRITTIDQGLADLESVFSQSSLFLRKCSLSPECGVKVVNALCAGQPAHSR